MYLVLDLGTSNSAVVGHSMVATLFFKTSDGTDVLRSVIYIWTSAAHRFIGKSAYDRLLSRLPQNVSSRASKPARWGPQDPDFFEGTLDAG